MVGIDREKNQIIVGEESEVYGDSFSVDSVNWINGLPPTTSSISAQVKIRYNHPGAEASLSIIGDSEVLVNFHHPQKAITPGQAAVFYDGETVLGGGWIKELIKQ